MLADAAASARMALVEQFEPYPSLALALLTGLLIGLEREQSRPTADEKRHFPGGIRTYPIFALLGAVGMMLSRTLGPWPLVVAGLALGAMLTMTHWRDASAGHTGLTSEASAFLTFLLGALALGSGVLEPLTRRVFVVASIAVATTVLLSQKTQLREFTTRVSKDDIIATLKFLIVSVVVLPLLPDAPYGPYGALNPYRTGMFVLLIASIGFVGYVAIRLLGSGRGLLLTGAVGGLVSSTAVTLASAARAKATPALAGVSALATVVASTIMAPRVLAIVFLAERSLVAPLLLPLGAMALVGLGFCLAFYLRDRSRGTEHGETKLTNPFELRSALQFGAFFVVITIVAKWANATFGASGTYVAGVLAGLTDVDVITLSMINLVKEQQIETAVAARTIVLAAAANTVTKGAMAVTLGGGLFGRRVALVFGAMLVAGVGLAFVAG